jgi:hypothetical protein
LAWLQVIRPSSEVLQANIERPDQKECLEQARKIEESMYNLVAHYVKYLAGDAHDVVSKLEGSQN